jgi:isoquinoline 1-oxidoreductase alpha subunit
VIAAAKRASRAPVASTNPPELQFFTDLKDRGEDPMIKLTVNGRPRSVDVEPEMPLLWVLRDVLDVKGPKYGCGIAQCGACTVHVNGESVRSCSFPVSAAAGKRIVTLEGLAQNGKLHPVQQAWIDHQVPQCGYCQGGQMMAAVALLKKNSNPSDRDIDESMTNICRCGTYARIREAIHSVAKSRGAKKPVKA